MHSIDLEIKPVTIPSEVKTSEDIKARLLTQEVPVGLNGAMGQERIESALTQSFMASNLYPTLDLQAQGYLNQEMVTLMGIALRISVKGRIDKTAPESIYGDLEEFGLVSDVREHLYNKFKVPLQCSALFLRGVLRNTWRQLASGKDLKELNKNQRAFLGMTVYERLAEGRGYQRCSRHQKSE